MAKKNHYDQGGFSVWDIIKAFCPHLEFCAYQGYLWGNIVKYILRCGWKDSLDGDLEKAAAYLQRLRQYREQLQCQKKSNAPVPDAAAEAGTTTEKASGSASTVTEGGVSEPAAEKALYYCQLLKRERQWENSVLFFWLGDLLK